MADRRAQKSQRRRRRRKARARARSARAEARAASRPSSAGLSADSGVDISPVLPSLYQLVFAGVQSRKGDEIRAALLVDPRRMRRIYFAPYLRDNASEIDDGWQVLRGYLDAVESVMASIIHGHSPYFWIHLYRRIGVSLHSGHEDKTDPQTVGLVRHILEVALLKHGRLEKADDMALTSEIGASEVMGGALVAHLVREFDENAAAGVLKQIMSAEQHVMREFSDDTLVDIYRLEGLAYEYWLTTARMRAIGKGASLRIVEGGFETECSEELSALFVNYDARLEYIHLNTSNIGVSFFTHPAERFLAIVPSYNAWRELARDTFPLPLGRVDEKSILNFVFGALDVGAYLESHRFIGKRFLERKGYHLESLCILAAGAFFFDALRGGLQTRPDVGRLIELHQRAYAVGPASTYGHNLAEFSGALGSRWVPGSEAYFSDEAPLLIESLTLSPEVQKRMSLWSGGPMSLFVPYGPWTVMDMRAIPHLLRTAFVGVRHTREKGEVFEDVFRELLTEHGLDVLPQRHLCHLGQNREVDAAVRVGDALYLCECRAMERPLDFEISNPETMRYRQVELEKKLSQALSLADFVSAAPKGDNYDFRWAKTIVPLVVSPFVEWVWSVDDRCWIDSRTPRILSADEAAAFIAGKPHKLPPITKRVPAKSAPPEGKLYL